MRQLTAVFAVYLFVQGQYNHYSVTM